MVSARPTALYFDRDPAELYRYREHLADLIERAPGDQRKQ